MIRYIPILLSLMLSATMLLPQEEKPKPEPAQRATGFKPPTKEKRALLQAVSKAKNGGRIEMFVRNQSLPAAFDCREKGWSTPVGDQADCGSCYLYSTVQTASAAFVKAGYGKPDGSFMLSLQYGMDTGCGHPDFGGCNGGWGAEVIDWMVRNPTAWPAETYVDSTGKQIKDYPPYEARTRTCRMPQGARKWAIGGWGYVNNNSSDGKATTDEIKAAMLNFGTLNVALDAGGQFGNGTGTITALGTQINHEIQVVGWDDAKDGGSFLLQNQWSTQWGNQGYRWATYNACRNCVEWFWVSVAPLPPPPPPPPPPVPGGVTITLSTDLKAGTYQIVPDGGGIALDPKMTLEELAALINKQRNPAPENGETKEPPTVKPEKPKEPEKKPMVGEKPNEEKPPEKKPEKEPDKQSCGPTAPWSPGVPFPQGMEKYERDGFTQRIHRAPANDPQLSMAPLKLLPEKWRTSGGLSGVEGWESTKYRLFPEPAIDKVDFLSLDGGVRVPGLTRVYADGTRFDDVLSNTDSGKVFEHRSRTLRDGEWTSEILYRDASAQPEGYTGISVKSCVKCHKDAGTGAVGEPLKPGGSEVFSDPLAWTLLRR